MHEPYEPDGTRVGLRAAMRNNYYDGQLLGVESFELETSYGIRQRRLLNRLVLGYGVVCGLNVELTDDGDAVEIWPGLAIDRHGNEIVAPQRSGPVPIPPWVLRSAVERVGDRREDVCVQVVICYHECPSDPVPVLAGDCDTPEPCTPSIIRERYRIEFRDDCASRPEHRCHVPDLLTGDRIDHDALARWVTRRNCTRLPPTPASRWPTSRWWTGTTGRTAIRERSTSACARCCPATWCSWSWSRPCWNATGPPTSDEVRR